MHLININAPDRYFLSLFAPRKHRTALWALIALNHEIAKTREVVNETRLGLIRLQWWRDEIGKLYDGGAGDTHEVLAALKPVITAHNLPKDDFDALIYGREFDLEDILPETTDGMMSYIQNTSAPLARLTAKILEIRDTETAEAVFMQYSLVGLLRAVPFHAAQERCYLPQSLLNKYNINPYALYKGKDTEKLPTIIKNLSKRSVSLRTEDRYLKATNAFSCIYKSHIIKHNYDVFKMAQSPPPAFKELRVTFKTVF